MDARLRRPAALLALALLVAAIAWASRRGAESPKPAADVDAAASETRDPTLAVAPETRSGDRVPAGTEAEGDSGMDPAARSADAEFPFGFVLGSDVDDPALPKERVPLAVTIVDLAGKPIPRAAVQAVWGEWRTKTYVADADGKTSMSVPRGPRKLEVVGIPKSETRRFLIVHGHPLVGDESEARVVVRVGSEIVGKVLRPDGTPLARASVTAAPNAFGFGAVFADEDGVFRLGVLDDSVVDVLAQETRPWQQVDEAEILRARVRNVRAGTTDVVLHAAIASADASLAIRVLTSTGEPVSGALVTVRPIRGEPRAFEPTDAGGRWRASDLLRAPLRLVVSTGEGTRGYPKSFYATFDTIEPDGSEIELRLPPPPTRIEGRVVDANGKPVERAWCAACLGATWLACFPTDADGRFSTTVPVPPGTRFQFNARFPMDQATSRVVQNDVVAGAAPIAATLEEIGPLESESRRKKEIRASVGVMIKEAK